MNSAGASNASVITDPYARVMRRTINLAGQRQCAIDRGAFTNYVWHGIC